MKTIISVQTYDEVLKKLKDGERENKKVNLKDKEMKILKRTEIIYNQGPYKRFLNEDSYIFLKKDVVEAKKNFYLSE